MHLKKTPRLGGNWVYDGGHPSQLKSWFPCFDAEHAGTGLLLSLPSSRSRLHSPSLPTWHHANNPFQHRSIHGALFDFCLHPCMNKLPRRSTVVQILARDVFLGTLAHGLRSVASGDDDNSNFVQRHLLCKARRRWGSSKSSMPEWRIRKVDDQWSYVGLETSGPLYRGVDFHSSVIDKPGVQMAVAGGRNYSAFVYRF